jgi:TM2 domain-containing membrane protein YozV
MSSAVCPYCRAPFDDVNGQAIECEGCGTPHHADCYEENGGCTVFGCAKAPGEEPKVAVSVPEVAGVQLSGVYLAGVSRPVYLAPAAVIQSSETGPEGTVPGVNSAMPLAQGPEAKNKMTFTMLGLFLGAFGAHNFYAGYTGKAVGQLCLSVLTLGFGIPMSWIWAVIEICIVNRDSAGVQFSS